MSGRWSTAQRAAWHSKVARQNARSLEIPEALAEALLRYAMALGNGDAAEVRAARAWLANEVGDAHRNGTPLPHRLVTLSHAANEARQRAADLLEAVAKEAEALTESPTFQRLLLPTEKP